MSPSLTRRVVVKRTNQSGELAYAPFGPCRWFSSCRRGGGFDLRDRFDAYSVSDSQPPGLLGNDLPSLTVMAPPVSRRISHRLHERHIIDTGEMAYEPLPIAKIYDRGKRNGHHRWYIDFRHHLRHRPIPSHRQHQQGQQTRLQPCRTPAPADQDRRWPRRPRPLLRLARRRRIARQHPRSHPIRRPDDRPQPHAPARCDDRIRVGPQRYRPLPTPAQSKITAD